MSKLLNKTRKRDTNYLLLLSLLLIIITRQTTHSGAEGSHDVIENWGFILAAFAAIGRVYCTAFLGGFKNQQVVDHGPFSVCRNPLYLFSLIGVTGIALMTVNILVIVILPLGVLLIYLSLIKREEVYLTEKFGAAYLAYKEHTPMLIPNFKLYHAPKTIEMTPRTIRNAMIDAMMWLLAFPLIEGIEYLQDIKVIKPLLYIYIG